MHGGEQPDATRRSSPAATRRCWGTTGWRGRRSRPGKANENGDVEQRHHRFKQAVDQALMLRGSRDFAVAWDYEAFLRRTAGAAECGAAGATGGGDAVCESLPEQRLESGKRVEVQGRLRQPDPRGPQRLLGHSRLIGEQVEARL